MSDLNDLDDLARAARVSMTPRRRSTAPPRQSNSGLRTWYVFLVVAAIGGAAAFLKWGPTIRDAGPTAGADVPQGKPLSGEERMLRAEVEELSESAAPFISQLQKLNARVAVGVNYNDFAAMVGEAQAAFDAIGLEEERAKTSDGRFVISFGGHALDAYRRAVKSWGYSLNDVPGAERHRDNALADAAKHANIAINSFKSLQFHRSRPDLKILKRTD